MYKILEEERELFIGLTKQLSGIASALPLGGYGFSCGGVGINNVKSMCLAPFLNHRLLD